MLVSLHHDISVCFSFFRRHLRPWESVSMTGGSLCSNRSLKSSLSRFALAARVCRRMRDENSVQKLHKLPLTDLTFGDKYLVCFPSVISTDTYIDRMHSCDESTKIAKRSWFPVFNWISIKTTVEGEWSDLCRSPYTNNKAVFWPDKTSNKTCTSTSTAS